MNKNLLKETIAIWLETIKITKKTVHQRVFIIKTNTQDTSQAKKYFLLVKYIYIKKKKTGACVFLAGKFNYFQTDVIEMQSSK